MTPDSPLLELLDLASRSPSGHNAQPWTFVRSGEQRLVLQSDPSRWLRLVDPTNRELVLSFGALIETIRQAASAVGYGVDIEILADWAEASDIARLNLTASPVVPSTAPTLIRSRATTRTPFLAEELAETMRSGQSLPSGSASLGGTSGRGAMGLGVDSRQAERSQE
jgi:hypothetical protein